MKTFYIDLSRDEATSGIVTRASSMEDALLQIAAFKSAWKLSNDEDYGPVERISAKPTRGVQYGEWE